MNLKILGSISVVISGFTVVASAQDGTLRAWLDAPETVNAGQTATVTAWVTFESDAINMDEAYFGVLQTSIAAVSGNSLIHSFSSAYGEYTITEGTPDASGINDIFAWQVGEWLFNYNIDTSSIVAAFSFDITTQTEGLGEIQLDFSGTRWRPDTPYFAWFLDFDESNIFVDSDMPNIEAIFEPVTIRVIPAPGMGTLLALAGVGALRRRR
jgi:hypothetical protein